MNSSIRLDGQKILITGVSRPLGIGATLTKRFANAGAALAVCGYSDYDLQNQSKSASKNATTELAENLLNLNTKIVALSCNDLSQKNAAENAIKEANQKLGTLDGLILNHAFSVSTPLGEWTEENIDSHLIINVRAAMLMIQAFSKQADLNKGGSVTLFTSGQYLGPMTDEIAYAVSKDAIIGLCKQTSAALAIKNIRVNCINPGPNDKDIYQEKIMKQ